MNRTKTILISAGVALLMLLAGYLLRGCEDNRVNELLTRHLKENTITKQTIDNLGRQVTTSTSNYITRDDLKSSDEALIKELREDVIGPIKSLEHSTRILARKADSLFLPVRDTLVIMNGREIPAKTFTYRSKYMPWMLGILTGDSVRIDYEILSDFKVEHHWKRNGLFAPKELEILVRSNDPAVRVNAVQQFSIIEPTPWYGKKVPLMAAGFGAGLVIGLIIDN